MLNLFVFNFNASRSGSMKIKLIRIRLNQITNSCLFVVQLVKRPISSISSGAVEPAGPEAVHGLGPPHHHFLPLPLRCCQPHLSSSGRV